MSDFGCRLLLPFLFIRNQCLDVPMQFYVMFIWCWFAEFHCRVKFLFVYFYWDVTKCMFFLCVWNLKAKNHTFPVRFTTFRNYGSCLFASFENFHKSGLIIKSSCVLPWWKIERIEIKVILVVRGSSFNMSCLFSRHECHNSAINLQCHVFTSFGQFRMTINHLVWVLFTISNSSNLREKILSHDHCHVYSWHTMSDFSLTDFRIE